MYDLKSLDRWKLVPQQGISFTRPEPRKVRLEVLSEKPTDVMILVHPGGGKPKAYYIGTFHGYDVVQFAVAGPFSVKPEGPGVSIWTHELEEIGVEIPDATSFTKVMTRRQRNPELELMMAKVSENMERRISQVTQDMDLRIAAERRRAEREKRAAVEQARRDAEKLDDDGGASEGGKREAPPKETS